jgi:CubicO group peptidase (beta-lactamase class C family)
VFGKPYARKAVPVAAVLLALATACSHGDSAQTAETSSAPAPVPVAPAPPPPALPPIAAPEYDFANVSKLINDAIAANELPGAVVLIGHGGKIVFHQAYGERKLAGEPGLDGSPTLAEPMTEDTIFDLASLTKPFATAPAVMQLYEREWSSSTIPCRSICRTSTRRTIRCGQR